MYLDYWMPSLMGILCEHSDHKLRYTVSLEVMFLPRDPRRSSSLRTLPNHTSHATQSIYSRPQLNFPQYFFSRVSGSGSLVQGYLRVYCPDSDIFLVTLGCCGSDIGHLYRRVCLRSQVWGSKAALFYVNGGFFNSHTRTTRVE